MDAGVAGYRQIAAHALLEHRTFCIGPNNNGCSQVEDMGTRHMRG